MEGCGQELVNPPLRTEVDRKAVIQALKDGTADVISTDHAPHTLHDKETGACGFTGIELLFPVTNTVLVNEEGFSLSEVSKLMSARPAEILQTKAGRIQEGFKANLVIVDTDIEWNVNSKDFYSKGKYTPLNGKTLKGKVLRTYHNGKLVFDSEFGF